MKERTRGGLTWDLLASRYRSGVGRHSRSDLTSQGYNQALSDVAVLSGLGTREEVNRRFQHLESRA